MAATPQPVAVAGGVATTAPFSVTVQQQAAIDAAIAKSLTGIQAGNTVGGFANAFQSALLANPAGLFTSSEVNSLKSAYVSATGEGTSFRDQGKSAAPFLSAWTQRINELFPVAAAAPVITPGPGATPTPIVVSQTPTAPVTIAAPPTAPSSAVSTTDPTAAAGQIASLVAALQSATAAATAAANPTTQTATALGPGSTASGNTATTGTTTATADNPADDSTIAALQAQLANLQAGITSSAASGTAGSGSVAGGVGVADDTSDGTTGLVATPTTTTGPDTTLLVVVLVLAIGAAAFWWFKIRKHGAATPHPSPAAA